MAIKVISRLSEEEKKSLKNGVIEVEGKAMNRTALGVVAAVFKLYPKITYQELKEILPDRINLAAPKTFKHGYRPFTELPYGVVQPKELVEKLMAENKRVDKTTGEEKENRTHFMEPDEMFTTSDGVTVCVSLLWESSDTETGENDLQNLIDHVKDYGIKVVSFEERRHYQKGGYNLNIVNPALFDKIQTLTSKPQKNLKPALVAASIAVLLVAFAVYFFTSKSKTPKQSNMQQEEKQLAKSDDKKDLENIEKKLEKGESVENESVNFHNILFEFNSDKILAESENDLNEALTFLKKFPNLKVKIIGHTSLEGTQEYNQKLSENRAKAVYDFLVKSGVGKERLSYEGKGMSAPLINENNETANKTNRRIEFLIVSQ